MESEGIISFARFMQTCLYCPKIGYYERQPAQIGRSGDFQTSVSVGPLFGRLLGEQFIRWLSESGAGPHQIVEAGAHDGRLASDILGGIRDYQAKNPAQPTPPEYWIIEPSLDRQHWQRARLEEFAGSVRWFESLAAIPAGGISGVIISNELLDAFPVHRFAWDANEKTWFEWGVAWQEGRFVWARLPAGSSDIEKHLVESGFDLPAELTAILPHGYVIEVSPAAAEWWRTAARSLRSGRLVAIDYGLEAHELLSPERTQGTLRSYSRHRVGDDLLATPGEQDLTANVNFTQLRRAAMSEGLDEGELIDQSRFLSRIAGERWKELPPSSLAPEVVRQFQTLTHPDHFGRRFRVLMQSRNVPAPS